MQTVIINTCPTGMIPTKHMNTHVPVTPQEIIACALRCAELGASIIHLHARDEQGHPTWKKAVYQRIIAGIRSQNERLILCVSTSGRNWNTFEKRADCLELKGDVKPDMASLTLGSMNFINQESVNSPEMIQQLAAKMLENDIKPELEVFDVGMIHKANTLLAKGLLPSTAPYFNIFTGSLGTAPFDPVTFGAMYHLLPDQCIWSLTGIGTYQLDANLTALAFGGHVRVGLEDNLYWDRERSTLASNEALVERIATLIKHMDRRISSPDATRSTLGLS